MAKECSNTSCSEESCEGCAGRQPQSLQEKMNEDSNISRVVGVVSGKGGVGKSFITASFANQLIDQGYRVGILDADITGPSIPKMYGLKGAAYATERGIQPMAAKNGIKVMSVNLLLPSEDSPVIWRGPVIANMVKQFWTDVIWGELDYLLVDMPPGTGDVPLTVFQSLPVDGAVIVSSPQELVKMIVKKAANMLEMMHVPVLGMVENYSRFICPDCGKSYPIFGESQADEAAAQLGLNLLGKVPVNPDYAAAADAGEFHEIENIHLSSINKFLK